MNNNSVGRSSSLSRSSSSSSSSSLSENNFGNENWENVGNKKTFEQIKQEIQEWFSNKSNENKNKLKKNPSQLINEALYVVNNSITPELKQNLIDNLVIEESPNGKTRIHFHKTQSLAERCKNSSCSLQKSQSVSATNSLINNKNMATAAATKIQKLAKDFKSRKKMKNFIETQEHLPGLIENNKERKQNQKKITRVLHPIPVVSSNPFNLPNVSYSTSSSNPFNDPFNDPFYNSSQSSTNSPLFNTRNSLQKSQSVSATNRLRNNENNSEPFQHLNNLRYNDNEEENDNLYLEDNNNNNNNNNQKYIKSATKIQKVFRGMKNRKRVKNMKTQSPQVEHLTVNNLEYANAETPSQMLVQEPRDSHETLTGINSLQQASTIIHPLSNVISQPSSQTRQKTQAEILENEFREKKQRISELKDKLKILKAQFKRESNVQKKINLNTSIGSLISEIKGLNENYTNNYQQYHPSEFHKRTGFSVKRLFK